MKNLNSYALIPLLFCIGLWIATVLAQTSTACSVLSATYAAPVLLSGWQAQLVATGLTSPRSILFDSNGHLLVVQSGHGVLNLELADGGGTCVGVAHKTYLINSTDVSTSPSFL
jgi:hypothetical protein